MDKMAAIGRNVARTVNKIENERKIRLDAKKGLKIVEEMRLTRAKWSE